MLRQKRLSHQEIQKIMELPCCPVDLKNSNEAYIDKCSAKIIQGGIYVTIYPIINGKIKGPREVRQRVIMDSVVRKNVIHEAQSKKNGKKNKKRFLSKRKYFPGRVSFASV